MHDFVYNNPTRVIFGRQTIARLGKETLKYGAKVLLVHGRGSCQRNQTYSQATDSLARAGIKVVEYGDIRANPTLEQVGAGIKLAKKSGIAAVVGLGGGSVLDSAKAIAAGVMADHDIWLFFTGQKSLSRALPVICVPTLAGSGSELNGGLVITNQEKKQKFGFANRNLFPRLAILDPTATFSVPAAHTAYGAVDALSHILEFYLTAKSARFGIQHHLLAGLAATIIESCPRALANPHDYRARADLMWGAALALGGLLSAGLGKAEFPMHLIAHAISGMYDLPHGASLSVVIPGWLNWQINRAPALWARFAKEVFQLTGNNEMDLARAGIKELEKWFTSLKSPCSLQAAGIPAGEIPALAEKATEQAAIWRLPHYNAVRIEEILKQCL